MPTPLATPASPRASRTRIERSEPGAVQPVTYPLRVLDLFSGIGGFSLGLERTGGFRTVAFCEIEEFPRRVLRKHWPDVPCYDDVRTLTAERLRADGVAVDVICGGFPCQDISTAGKGAGLDGERSGLWSEFARLVGELRPRYVLAENVARLRSKGLDRVLGSLDALGYDAEWHCVPASAAGAPHRRDRLWLLAYSADPIRWADARSLDAGQGEGSGEAPRGPVWKGLRGAGDDGPSAQGAAFGWPDGWRVEPPVGRVVDGVPAWVDAALGNAVVPQVVELLGRAILAREVAAE